MRNPIEIAKSHPYLTGAGVFVVAVVLVIILSSGSETETVETNLGGYNPYAPDPTSIQANAMLAQGQLDAQVAAKALDNKLAESRDATAAAAAIARANFDYLTNKDVIAGRVAVRGYEADERIAAGAQAVTTAEIRAASNVRNAEVSAGLALGLAGIERDRFIATRAAEVENNRINSAANVDLAKNQSAASLRQQELGLEAYKVHSNNYNTQLQSERDFTAANANRELEANRLTLEREKTYLDYAQGNYRIAAGK